MGKCKVRIHRLTLAPGSLGCSVQREKGADQDAEEDRLHDSELLHNALEVKHFFSKDSSSYSWCCQHHEYEDEVDFMVDNLTASMSNMSLASTVRSLRSVSKLSPPIKVLEPSVVIFLQDTVHLASASSISTKRYKIEHVPPQRSKNTSRPWEGPPLALRISPKWCLGDAL
jgi:hypothetical protein